MLSFFLVYDLSWPGVMLTLAQPYSEGQSYLTNGNFKLWGGEAPTALLSDVVQKY